MKSLLTTLAAVAGLMLGASVANAQPRPQQPRPIVVVQPVVRPVVLPPVFAPRPYPYYGNYNTYNYGFNYSYGRNAFGQTYGGYSYGFYQQNRFGFWGW